MALDALGIPHDIPWRRLAWTHAMLHRLGAALPPKWRSSVSVYAYPVPLEDTEEEYPDDRIVYLKLTTTITGWTVSEGLPTFDELDSELDDWQTDAWQLILNYDEMHKYWACQNAIAQISIFPYVEPTPAKLDLTTLTAHVTTILSASVPGSEGNEYTFELVAGTPAGLVVDGPQAKYRFESGVTTVADLEAAIATSEFLEVTSAGNPAAVLDSGDALEPTALSGGVDSESAVVGDEEYPYFIDFEPKKRELYESVTESGESLSGSSGRISTQKGNTTTASVELEGKVPIVNIGSSASLTHQWSESTTTDSSTDRRETQSRSTQLSQMYQLFNGYHLGTNRAVFALFPRPHVVNQEAYQQSNYNLINGQRQLEGVQDVFLVTLMPRTVAGICVEAWLDTAHRAALHRWESPNRFIVTRRAIHGCGTFDGDRLVLVPPAEPPDPQVAPVPGIVGEGLLEMGSRFRDRKQPGEYAASGVKERVETADNLNLLQVELRQKVLSLAASGSYPARALIETETFYQLASESLQKSEVTLAQLVTLEHITAEEKTALERRGIKNAGGVFVAAETDDNVVLQVRQALLDALSNTGPSRLDDPPIG